MIGWAWGWRLESGAIPNLDQCTFTRFMALADRERKVTGIGTKEALLPRVVRPVASNRVSCCQPRAYPASHPMDRAGRPRGAGQRLARAEGRFARAEAMRAGAGKGRAIVCTLPADCLQMQAVANAMIAIAIAMFANAIICKRRRIETGEWRVEGGRGLPKG